MLPRLAIDLLHIGSARNSKKAAELKPFSLTGDSFRKIIVRNDVGLRWYDENGIQNVNLLDFLLDETII